MYILSFKNLPTAQIVKIAGADHAQERLNINFNIYPWGFKDESPTLMIITIL